MFYFAIGVWVIGYLAFCGLMKVECSKLFITCPCVVIGTALTSIILYLTHHTFAAFVVMVAGVSFSLLIIYTIYRQKSLPA